MPLISNAALRSIADTLAPRLSEIARRDGCITDDAMLAAIKQARKDGEPVPNVGSVRSLRLIEQFYRGDAE